MSIFNSTSMGGIPILRRYRPNPVIPKMESLDDLEAQASTSWLLIACRSQSKLCWDVFAVQR